MTITRFQEEHKAQVRGYFMKLGLSQEVADIYLALSLQGSQTISELARSSGIERTYIYRLANELMTSGLVEVEVQYKKSIYKAAPITNVQILIAKKEQELKELQTGLTEIKDIFMTTAQRQGTKVQFYSGEEGAKQFFWNETKANDEMVCILFENMQTKTNSRFFERWVRRCNDRKLTFRGIVSDTFVENQESWYASHQNERLQHWESRILSDKEFPITHSTITYDNVTAHYSWKSDEVFALEIYNKEIADTQRRYFELLWSKAHPIAS